MQTNTNIITLSNALLSTQLRVIDKDGQPWFVAKDVCDTLELTNPSMAIQALDDDERSKFNLGRQGLTNIISESGLYTLILRSRDAVNEGTPAHSFRKWVTNEILPAIRREGFYASHLSPAAREAQALEYRLRASKLRAEAASLEDKAKSIHTLDGGTPIMDWLKQNHPQLSDKQRANHSRTLKARLISSGKLTGKTTAGKLTALPEDLSTVCAIVAA